MTTGRKFGARAATYRTKEAMLIVLGLLLSTPALAAADSDTFVCEEVECIGVRVNLPGGVLKPRRLAFVLYLRPSLLLFAAF